MITFEDVVNVLNQAGVEILTLCEKSQEVVVNSNGKTKVIKTLSKDVHASDSDILFDDCWVSMPKLGEKDSEGFMVNLSLGKEHQASI